MGRFKAPTLRNIAVTAPYMHDGSIAHAGRVVRHYEAGGRTIAAGPSQGVRPPIRRRASWSAGSRSPTQERGDLVAFLESLTDQAFISDPRFANPWPQK